jgi:ParB family transcriptional regulator, chromosome partitioning protein
MAESLRNKLKNKKVDFEREEPEEHPIITRFTYREGDFVMVKVDEVLPNPDQPRQHFDQNSLTELSQSIKEKGVLQPVIVRVERENEKIYLVAGERRWRASKEAGLEKIPAMVTTGDPLEIALIENLQREDLNPLEEAKALDRLMKEHNYTQESLASVVGKSRTTVTEILSLNRLPGIIKEECTRGTIYPRRILIEVAKQKSPKKMIELFNKVKKLHLTSEEVRKMTRVAASKEKYSTEDIVFVRLKSLYKYLTSIDLDAFSSDKKSSLEKLKSLLEQILK